MKTVRASYGNGQGGFTLVELMVALVITLFVLAGLFMAFQTNRETFKFNEKLLRIQDSGRFALESIVRDLRMAGDVGCIRSALDQEDDFPTLAGKIQVGAVVLNGLSGTGLSDKLIQGLDWNGSDELTIYGIPVDGGSTYLWSDCNGSSVTTNNTPAAGAVYQVLTGYRTYKFGRANPTAPFTITMTDPLNATGSPLLENVERFAICFGVDNSGTLGGDMQGKEIHWYPNPNPFPTGDDLNKMLQKTVAVKIQMVIASEPDEGKGTPAEALSVATSTSYTFCDPSKNYTSESDKRLRKRFSATATLRNKVANGYGPNGWLEAK